MYKKAVKESNLVVILEITDKTFSREVDIVSVIANKYMAALVTSRLLMHKVSKSKPFLSTHSR